MTAGSDRNPGGGLLGLLRGFRQAERGTIAVIGALALPALLVVGVGGIELQQVLSDRRFTQDIADEAAIMGAQQLAVAKDGAASRAQAFADAQMADLKKRSTVTVTATLLDKGQMKVAVDTHRMSFFANLLPPGGFYTHAEATAKGEGMVPLCVLGIATSDDIHMTSTSQLQAGQCMVHSNHDLRADGGAAIQAGGAEAVNAASGAITPGPDTGAKAIDDPFINLPMIPPLICNIEDTDFSTKKTTVTLAPGLHCADVTVTGGATVVMARGEHWFQKQLVVDDKSSLDGTAGVVLVFQNAAKISISGKPKKQNVNLKGAKSGPFAGFVLVTTRDYVADFTLPADNIDQITGTLYLPKAKLIIDGDSKSGATSPWTVVAAKGLQVNKTVNLIINANYATTDVPLPDGVGNKAASTRLVK